MQKINKSPVLTSNNFNINYFEVDENELFLPYEEIENYITKTDNISFLEKADFTLSQNIFSVLQKPSLENTIKIEKSSSKPMFLNFGLDNKRVFHKLRVEINEGVKQNIVLNITLKNSFLKNEIYFDIKKNSELEVVLFLDEKDSKDYLNIETSQEENSSLKLFLVSFSNNTYVVNVFSKNKGDNSKFFLNNISFGTEGAKLDQNFLIHQLGRNSFANMVVLNALNNTARKSFKGTIDFKRGAKKSQGYESEYTILLSSGTISKALPMLLCEEEEVEGSHSSSAGKLEEDKMFYLTSRGLDEFEAIKLLVKAKFSKITNDIFDEETKNMILAKIDRSIDGEK